jgi:uncharacterized protein DUF397
MEGIDQGWRKSSRSGNGGGECVEVATHQPGIIVVRDSKDPDGPVLAVAPAGWRDFIADMKTGQHDLT